MEMEVEGATPVGDGAAAPSEADKSGEVDDLNSTGVQTIGFTRILECDVVMEHLVQYLSVQDMKVLSSVCKDALIAVRNTNGFGDRTQFEICERSVGTGVLEKCSYPWKNLHVSCDSFLVVRETLALEDYPVLLHLLESDESLKIEFDSFEPGNSAHEKLLVDLLKSAKSLRGLEIRGDLFFWYLQNNDDDLVGLKQFVSNLESLNFCDWSFEEELVNKLTLRIPEIQFRLKRLKIFGILGLETLLCLALKVIANSQATLEELRLLPFPSSSEQEELKSIRCPNLKKLELSSWHRDDISKGIEVFLRNQPPLEELKMRYCDFLRLLPFLRGRMSKIRKLFIVLTNCEDLSLQNWDQDLMSTMTNLKTLKIDDYSGARDLHHAVKLLCELPSNTLRKLRILGSSAICPRFRVLDPSRFANLTELSLELVGFIDDACLQSFIRCCSNLMRLELIRLPNITDFGISGVTTPNDTNGRSPSSSNGASLSDLKSLVELEISFCRNITKGCLLTVVRFDSLHSLKLELNSQFGYNRAVFKTQILGQNPRLQDSRFQLCYGGDRF